LLLNNVVELNVCGEQIERFLNMCSFHNIKIFDIQRKENSCHVKINAEDFFVLKDIRKKTGVKIQIIHKEGFYFRILKQAKRKLFIISSLLCLFLLWISSQFLWGIQIEGNKTITKDLITDYLQENHIYFGMPLSKIPINELKTDLRNTYDEITWISIYLKGTNLHISIKERDTKKPSNSQFYTYSDIAASENGIVDSILVRQGTAMVKVGDEVSKGDILISGKVDIIADDYTIKETYLCNADGDVYLIYNYPIEEQISLEYLTKEYTGNQIQKMDLYYKNSLIPIPHLKIPYTKYDSVTETIDYPLCNILSIPIAIKQTTYREYQMIRKKYNNLEAEKLLKNKLDKIFLSLEEKGVQIIEKNVKISTNSAYLSATGNITVKSCCNKLQAMEECK